MTWNHPRGLDPLVAHARAWEQASGVRVEWDARSLEDFEAFSLDELAAKYDLMVIDHPHVGMAAASGCLLPFDPSIHLDTVGQSHESYNYDGKQWALAIDAAAQVSARRAGALERWPVTWEEVIELAREGRVVCPLAPVHSLMCFFTLCANLGQACAIEGEQLVSPLFGAQVLERLCQFGELVPEFCFEQNPIDVLEYMAADSQFAYSPLVYGYASYARNGFRPVRIEFGNIPGIRGSALGGTGVAVSARAVDRDAAVAVAQDLASAKTQRGVYASAGGQPAHRDAWSDNAVNAATHDFFRNTLATIDSSYIRPRFAGYIEFQESAGRQVRACLHGDLPPVVTVERLNSLFVEAQRLQ